MKFHIARQPSGAVHYFKEEPVLSDCGADIENAYQYKWFLGGDPISRIGLKDTDLNLEEGEYGLFEISTKIERVS